MREPEVNMKSLGGSRKKTADFSCFFQKFQVSSMENFVVDLYIDFMFQFH